jgi:hypothetical protein
MRDAMESVTREENASAKPLVAPRVPDHAVLDRVIVELQEIERRTGIDRTIAIGELILTRFFGGDPAAWRDRRRNKNNSVRRLAGRVDCPFSKSALHEAVGVYVGVLALPSIRKFAHVSTSHVASVLQLPEPAREQLLESAERGRWSVRELRQNVVSLRRTEGERRGRPALDRRARMLGSFRKYINQLSEGVQRLSEMSSLDTAAECALAGFAGELASLSARLRELAQTSTELISTRHSEVRQLECK